jgi:hypothetical protein
MPPFDPEKFEALLSGASDPSQAEDLEAMISRLDKKWAELKELLRDQENPAPREQPHQTAQAEEDHDLNNIGCRISSLEASAIVDKVGKLGEDTRILQRLARLERRNLGLTFYAIFCTLLFLGMLLSTVMLEDNSAQTMETIQQGLRPRLAAAATNPAVQPPSFPTRSRSGN